MGHIIWPTQFWTQLTPGKFSALVNPLGQGEFFDKVGLARLKNEILKKNQISKLRTAYNVYDRSYKLGASRLISQIHTRFLNFYSLIYFS